MNNNVSYLQVPGVNRVNASSNLFSDNSYDYPSFSVDKRSTNHVQNADTDTTSDHFNDSLTNNILYGVTNMSEPEILALGGSGSNEESHSSDKKRKYANTIHCAPCLAYSPNRKDGESREKKTVITQNALKKVNLPVGNTNNEYDYDSPYWAPADRKTELLSQFRKLRIPSVTQKDLE